MPLTARSSNVPLTARSGSNMPLTARSSNPPPMSARSVAASVVGRPCASLCNGAVIAQEVESSS
eukprot:15448062-Alexandrium_andersonii.AAC.1